MAKKPDTSASTRPQEPETLNGSNTLPATIEIAAGHTVQLGEVVMAAHQNSGLSIADWNALPEADRDGLLNKTLAELKTNPDMPPLKDAAEVAPEPRESMQVTAILNTEAYEALFEQAREQLAGMDADVAEVALKEMQRAVDALGEKKFPLPEPTPMISAEQVLIVSAPGGPRRRAGFSFGPVPVDLRAEDLGDNPQAVLEALRADPLLKIDGRFEERPAD